MAPSKDEETRKKLLENLKKEVKQLMEEAVTKKFIHADSSSITSLCGAVEAGIAHGLKKRAAGLLPAQDTQSVLLKLAKLSEPAAELVKKLSGEEDANKDGKSTMPGPAESPILKMKLNFSALNSSVNKKINGYNISGHCGKFLWIRIALLEKLLRKIVEDLQANASQFYEPEALLSDPADGRIFIELLDGPCALDFSKMKTPDSYWTDPSADELVQRHRIHSGLFQQTPAMTTSTSRPQLGARMSSYDENVAVAPLLAREHIDSLHQNSYAALLYGKNNVYLEPHEEHPIAGYLSLHKSNESLLLKWTPNKLMSGSCEQEKSQFWDYALTVNLHDVVYIHCHQHGVYGVVILIGQDGVQRPPIRFPTTGSLLSFLNCLENGLHPHGELDPPLFNPRSKGLGLPRLKRPSAGDNVLLSAISKGENTNQDYVFRLVSGTKPEDLVNKEMDRFSSQRSIKKQVGLPWKRQDLSMRLHSSFKRNQKQSSPHTMECLSSACETMRRQITLRAFNGWLSYVRHLKTVRTHLLWLVRHNKISSEENGVDYTQGLTEQVWRSLYHKGQIKDEDTVKKYVYFGGIEHSIRKEVWPYLLGHYKFGSTSRDRQETDRTAQNEFRSIMEEWKDVESVIQQQEKEHEVDGISMGSTGSRDEVYEQLEMIHNGLEKSEAFTHQRVSIEEPEIEGLDEAAKARLMNGQLIIPHQNGDDAESGCCSDCGEENVKITSSLRTCQKCSKSFDSVAELNGNATGHIPNGHGSRHNSEKDSDGDMDSPIYCKQCSRTSNGSKSSCPYSTELLDDFGLNLHRIEKDVLRCDRNYPYFTHENLNKLRNVISSYVWKTLDVGYVQGMCDLVAPLLVIFDNEAITYSCFVDLMQRMNNNFPHGGAMDTHFANMRSLIQILDPEMFEHLQQNGDLTHFYFCYRWFLLDFKRELVYDDVFVVWETIWAARHCTSEHFVLFIALALLQFYRDIILDNKMDFTDIIKFFNEMAERHDARAALSVARGLVAKVQDLIKNQ
ncbi:Small G protein signaling modulator 2 [Porites harrisoni]